MDQSLHQVKKPKLHIYPFSDSWILINDFEPESRSFQTANEALETARKIFGKDQEHEIIIHSKYDSLPHFRIAS